MNRIPEEQREVALDLVYDRRREGYDPLQELMQMFEGVSAASSKESRAAELAALPLLERLARRIVDGERNGLEADLDEAMTQKPPLDIINENLLAGMKTVGELFGSGQMQLPFVLQSAEVMKSRGGVPRAAHGEGPTTTPARAASCWPPSRATCTTSARTSSTSS